MPDRPIVMTLVGYVQEPYGLMGTPRLVPLSDAPDWAQHGWTVMVDPWDLEALTRFEQLSRPPRLRTV